MPLVMKEEFITYLWKNRLIHPEGLQTTEGEPVTVIHPGQVNHDAGPDFSAAKIKIGSTIWAGNVEIHVMSSDWMRHGHQFDEAYDNIILHLVYEIDQPIVNTKGEMPPTLAIKNHIDLGLLNNYQRLTQAKTWIACMNNITQADKMLVGSWLSRLLIERLERKTMEMAQLHVYFSKNWEETLYFLLARNFGFKVNATSFGLLARKTPLHALKKVRDSLPALEAILFGQAGMLNDHFSDNYPIRLKNEYIYQQKKLNLSPVDTRIWKFSRMRPGNFPTIRIAQFAQLIHQHETLFNGLILKDSIQEIADFLSVSASSYWNTHFRFEKPTPDHIKRLGGDAIDNIIINTVAPFMFLYGKESLNEHMKERAILFLHQLAAENNHIIRKWETAGIKADHAADSQALIELKKNYCTPKKCLNCRIGYQLLLQPEG